MSGVFNTEDLISTVMWLCGEQQDILTSPDAFQLIYDAAEQGQVESQLKLVDFYFYGYQSVLDYERGKQLLDSLVDREIPLALFKKGILEIQGKGYSQDIELGKLHIGKAHQLNCDQATFFIAHCSMTCKFGYQLNKEYAKLILRPIAKLGNETALRMYLLCDGKIGNKNSEQKKVRVHIRNPSQHNNVYYKDNYQLEGNISKKATFSLVPTGGSKYAMLCEESRHYVTVKGNRLFANQTVITEDCKFQFKRTHKGIVIVTPQGTHWTMEIAASLKCHQTNIDSWEFFVFEFLDGQNYDSLKYIYDTTLDSILYKPEMLRTAIKISLQNAEYRSYIKIDSSGKLVGTNKPNESTVMTLDPVGDKYYRLIYEPKREFIKSDGKICLSKEATFMTIVKFIKNGNHILVQGWKQTYWNFKNETDLNSKSEIQNFSSEFIVTFHSNHTISHITN